MSKRLHWIIPTANELGYFPTTAQAKEISARAAYLYGVHFDGNPPKGPVVQNVFDRFLRQAMEEIMTGSKKRQ